MKLGLSHGENGVMRKIFEPKRNEVTGSGGNCIFTSFMICTAHHIFK